MKPTYRKFRRLKFRRLEMSLAKRIAIVMCGLVLFTSVVSVGVIYWRFNEQLVTAKIADLELETNIQATRLTSQVDEIARDVLFLSRTAPVLGVIRAKQNSGVDPKDGSTQGEWQQRAAFNFREMIDSKPSYVQIRLIGVANNGKEVIRVDAQSKGRPAKVIEEQQLQEKGARDYFREAMAVPAGEVYLSAIELNRELGEIQRPFLPVVRAAVQLTTEDGEPFGILVINYDLTRLFTVITTVSNPSHRYYLGDGQGSFLRHSDRSAEFGFEFDNPGLLYEAFPSVRRLEAGDAGVVSELDSDERLVRSFRRVKFGSEEVGRSIEIIATDSFDDITAISRDVFRQVGLVLLVLVMLSLLVGLWLAKRITRPITKLTHSVRTADFVNHSWEKPSLAQSEAAELCEALDKTFLSLQQHAAELAESNVELSHFAFVASHDLQEPLRTISNFSMLLSKRYGDEFDEAGVKYLKFITDSCDRMRALITGLLEYSQWGTAVTAAQVDLDEVIRSIEQDMAATISHSKAQITVEPLPTLNVYANEMRVLLQNLLSNAMKYVADDVTPKVHVSCEQHGSGWLFSVSDNGVGIAPEYREQVFGIFKRLHNRAEYEGTGIGLANCSKIVALHKGEIWVEDSPLGGATFKFVIHEIEESSQ